MARLYPTPAQDPALSAALSTARQDGSITTPPQQDFDTPAMEGSMQQFLSENLGTYVIIEFLIGTQSITRKAGILYAVGTSVVTLYEEISQTFITCDIFSIKFVTFYLPGRRPWMVSNPLFNSGTSGMAPGFAPSVDMSSGMGSGVMDQGQDFTNQPGCVGPGCPPQSSIGWG